MANGHIHVQTKFSNKSINYTVGTDFIHTNTETIHIYLIKRHNTPIKKLCILIKNILLYMLIIFSQALGLVRLTPGLVVAKVHTN